MKSALRLLQATVLISIGTIQLSADTLYGNAGIGSATISLTGADYQTVTANSNGYFSFRRVRFGNYVVTPSLSGYTFSPASQSVTVVADGVIPVSFTATPTSVTPPTPPVTTNTETELVASPSNIVLIAAGSTGQLAVEASYSNGATSNVTGSGTYISNNTSVATVSQAGLVTAVSTGSAMVVVSYGGLSSNVSISVNIPVITYNLSGSAGVASAAVAISGAAQASTTASSTGAFSFSSLPAGSYIVTPSLTGYTFNPASQSATITNASVSGMTFAATETPHSVSLTWGAGSIQDPAPGQVVAGYNVYRSPTSGGPYTQLNSSPVAGLTYTDSAVSAGQTWYYVCSTVDNMGDVSANSSQAVVMIPGS